MPRFVILEHDHPELHWDLMLEAGAVLWTWRLSSPPRIDQQIYALRTFDHRPLYLDYEGPISGDRGSVVRREKGTFSWDIQTDERLQVRLMGELLRGVLRLWRVQADKWEGELVDDSSVRHIGAGEGNSNR
jgi:hypothetical protein